MDEFQLKLLKNGCDWKVGRRETVSEPPIQFSLQPGSHSRIMSWALSRQSPHLSLEQFNISLELLKNKRDLSAVRLSPEKWLRQKVVFRFKKWKRIISHHIWDETERIEGWCFPSSPTGKGGWWKVPPLWGEVILSESLVVCGGEREGAGVYWDGEIVSVPPEININDVQ